MKVTCGSCGKKTEAGAFCEKCGAVLGAAEEAPAMAEPAVRPPADAAVPASGGADSPSKPPFSSPARTECPPLPDAPPPAAMASPARGPVLEVDRMCVQFEDLVGTVRFRLDPGPGGMDNVRLALEHPGTGRRSTWGPRRLRGRGEIRVQLDGQTAGCPTWTVRLACEKDGRTQRWEGDVDLLVVRPREAQRTADNLKVEITNHITMGNASDAHVNQRALDGLERLAAAENPFDELRRVVCGGGRSWSPVDLYESTLPPAGALRDRVAVEWGGWTVRIFGEPEVRFGRDRPGPGGTDFTLRPGPGGRREPYGRISRMHCTFARCGGGVEVRDGVRSDSGPERASSNGTWWEGRRLRKPERLAAGAAGTVAFGGAAADGAVALRVECGDGWLLLRRQDGVREAFLMLWGEFGLSRLDSAAGKLRLCRRDGAFAWQAGSQCGWVVPGESSWTPAGRLDGI